MKNRIGLLIIAILLITILLLTQSTGQAIEAIPYARVSSSQDILVYPEATLAVPFNTIGFNTGLYNPQHPTRLTATQDCLYLIVGQFSWTQPYLGRGFLYIVTNGQARIAIVEGLEDQSITALHPLQTGEYVELYVYIMGEASMRIRSIPDHSPVLTMVCLNNELTPQNVG